MNWKLKSAIQRGCSVLPWGSETVYYRLQRTFGSLRHVAAPTRMLEEMASLASWLNDAGVNIEGARILEVGTGRRLDMPLGFYLAGCGAIDTFDLHRYLKFELVRRWIALISLHPALTESVVAPIASPGLASRLQALSTVRNEAELLKLTSIEYHAPADASQTGLEAGGIDIHTSYTVFEHVPPRALQDILQEARRVLSPRGVVLHHIDPSDHFSHDDRSIDSINFLQFSEKEWNRYAGNQFAYHNRLRCCEYRSLFEACGFKILRWEESVDDRAMERLKSGFALDAQFREMPSEALCGAVVRILARPH